MKRFRIGFVWRVIYNVFCSVFVRHYKLRINGQFLGFNQIHLTT